MAEHQWYKCKQPCDGCQFCDGGLGLCTVCGAFEGQLLPTCPGEALRPWERDACWKGHVKSVGELAEQRRRIRELDVHKALAWQRLLAVAEELVDMAGALSVTVQLELAPTREGDTVVFPKPLAAVFT